MGDHALADPAAIVVCTQGTERVRPLFAEDEREEKKKKTKKERKKCDELFLKLETDTSINGGV